MDKTPLSLGFSDDLWLTRDVWESRRGGRVAVCFAGKGLPEGREAAVRSLVPEGVEAAWLQQVHSAVVHDAQSGACGEGDALISAQRRLALSVVTADCVPVLLAGENEVAAVHAGWRGVAAEIVAATCVRFREQIEVAWIGPAISGEVYEVSPEVADQVLGVSDPSVIEQGPAGRPHVSLREAVAHQLRQAGVREIRSVAGCTFRDADRLWSYRRDGQEAGRNVSLIWRE